MAHKPLSMKALSKVSQKPMAASEKPVKASTLDLMHAAELARRSTVQQSSAAREVDRKRKP